MNVVGREYGVGRGRGRPSPQLRPAACGSQPTADQRLFWRARPRQPFPLTTGRGSGLPGRPEPASHLWADKLDSVVSPGC